ncbi:alpha-L-fucosidase [Persicirhabdus sediminis]|uniref:Alpha-L-fucosidase n=1 Tax=Persicirhabdus sediminis TaxID=454144 RepID=A0A8J7MD27_9BACT|nr:alpha-L-fucosidase [Persicirhabdus sediminis]MBK1789889.1 alpha-L-fucosidase [Persicirhabdus sediminis]
MMMKQAKGTFCLPAALGVAFASALTVEAEQKYESDYESLANYQAPEWYQDAKLGVWPIWGVYSVPCYAGTHAAEWYAWHMYDTSNANWHFEHHKKTSATRRILVSRI